MKAGTRSEGRVRRHTAPPKSRRGRGRARSAPLRVVAAAAIVVAGLGAPLATPGQEYSVFGTVEAEAALRWAELGEPATTLRVPVAARLTHSIAGDAFDLTARTVLAPVPAGDGGTAVADPAGEATPAEGSPLAIRLPELSLSAYPAPWLTTRVGRFDLDWGGGYLFSPGSSLGPDPDGGAGVTGASFSIIPSTAVTLGAAASLVGPVVTDTGEPWREIVGAAWVDGYAGGVDWFAGVQYQADRILRPSLALSVDLAGTIVAGEAAVELAERYEYPAGGFSFEPRDEPAPLASLAVQRTFAGQNANVGATAEYLFTALGHTETEVSRLYELVLDGPVEAGPTPTDAGAGIPVRESARGETAPLGRNYLAVNLSFEWYETASVSALALTSLTDGSVVGRGEAALLTFAPLEFYMGARGAWGADRRTEFGIAGSAFELSLGSRVSF